MPGAELAEQEGAGNTETEQAAGEEGDERAALYEQMTRRRIRSSRLLRSFYGKKILRK